MKLPSVRELNVKGKRVLLRLDLDTSPRLGFDGELSRTARGKQEDFGLESSLETINHLVENGAKLIIIGHKGRPQGVDGKFSLAPVAQSLGKILNKKIQFVYDITGKETEDEVGKLKDGEIVMLENLRFDKGEENCDSDFTKRLASLGDLYVNEAFSVCHREHSSIVGIPKILPHAAGFRLIKEVENLGKILDNPASPVVFILGGGKPDKAKYVDKLLIRADWVLVGGVLPRVVSSYCKEEDEGKACVAAAKLLPSGRDIDEASSTNFTAIITNAGTVVWNGPLGEYENSEFRRGTEVVAHAIAESDAFKVVGGGDTVDALTSLGILSKMNWVSTGGGAMLEFLAEGDLPGLSALRT